MARSGYSTTNLLRAGAAPITAVPCSMACWGKTSIVGTQQCLMGVFNSGSAPNRNCLRLDIAALNTVGAAAGDAGNNDITNTTTTISANTWFHACATFTTNATRAAYLNGGGKVSGGTGATPTGINKACIGIMEGSSGSNPFGNVGTGLIAEAAIWNVVLTDAEVLMLAAGVSPLKIRPDALVGYWPLIGDKSVEPNYFSNASSMSIIGTVPQAAHPRIIMPKRRRMWG